MEEKTYTYRPEIYALRITATGILAIGVLLYSIYKMIINFQGLYVIIAIVCIYNTWESFITLANPSQVIVSDEKITFKHKSREDTYYWKDIHDFRVKDNPYRKQVYIRINKDQFELMRGRYWVFCYFFSDCDELFTYLLKKEMEIHPDTIKAYARRGSKPVEKK